MPKYHINTVSYEEDIKASDIKDALMKATKEYLDQDLYWGAEYEVLNISAELIEEDE